MGEEHGDVRTRRLLEAGRSLMEDLDTGAVLDRLLQAARDITGARYAALGILDEQRTELEQFLTSGVDEALHRTIGALPRGRGVLGALIGDPRPLRLANVADHPTSYGFPASHPVMRSFLGVPVLIRGQAWGNLYLTEKEMGEFSDEDEQAVVVLAQWAGIAIENARLYERSELRRQELEKAMRALEATRDVAAAIGGEIDLGHVLELIVKRGRALVGARSLVIMLREGEELVVRASAGYGESVEGLRLPIAESTSGQVLERGWPERITDVASRLRIAPRELGVPDAKTALLVPMVYRGSPLGILAAFDQGEAQAAFSADDEQTLRTFAASAATAVALAQSVQADRLRSSLAAADAERRRWARELHDETLQGLGGLRLLLSSVTRSGELGRMRDGSLEAIEHIDREIANLRALISELRPAALDELGLATALQALLDRQRERGGPEVYGELALPPAGGEEPPLDEELQTTVYRLVQEALTNAAKHACAENVWVRVVAVEGRLEIEVADDGIGFDTTRAPSGFGLAGMRERVALSGGTMTISSGSEGTVLRASLPLGADVAAGDQEARRPRLSA